MLRRKIRPPLTQLVKHSRSGSKRRHDTAAARSGLSVFSWREANQTNAGRVDSARPQLRERVKPLPRIFVQQQIKVGRDGIVLDYMSGKHATMRS